MYLFIIISLYLFSVSIGDIINEIQDLAKFVMEYAVKNDVK